MIKKLKTNESIQYQKLSPEEMKARGILGRLVGPCADFINPTRNGRKYSEQLWENVFNNPLMQEKIKNGVCYGELGHPEDRTETDIEKIAICLREQPVKNDKGQLVAVFDILDTPCGRILKTLCDYGSKLGISSRGQGDLVTDYNGDESVDPDTYECECWDVVLVPGVETARLDYMTESLNTKNKKLKIALKESLNEAEDKDKKIMEDTLKNLNIVVEDDSKEDQVEVIEEESTSTEDLNDKLDFLVKDEDEAIEGYEDVMDSIDNEHLIDQLDHIKDEEEAHKKFLNAAKEDPSIDYEDYEHEDKKEEINVDTVIEFLKSNKDETVIEKIKDLLLSKEEETEDEKSDKEPSLDNNETEEVEEVEETEEPADDDGEDEVLEQLKEALKAKKDLTERLQKAQNDLAVSDSKVIELSESCETYKKAIERLSRLAQKNKTSQKQIDELTESLKESKETIEEQKKRIVRLVNSRKAALKETNELKEQLEKSNEDVKQLNSLNENLKLNSEQSNSTLKESFEKQVNDLTQKTKTLTESLEKATKLKESYKEVATKAANKYIEVKALMLGLTPRDIKRKLAEHYSLEQVDQVCEDLKSYQLNITRLPFSVNNKVGIRVNESNTAKNSNVRSNRNEDDDVDDSLIHLANL